jgi:hypothetical protein
VERYILAFWLDERNGRAEGKTKASEGCNVVKKREKSYFELNNRYGHMD